MRTCTSCKQPLSERMHNKLRALHQAWWGLCLIYRSDPRRCAIVFAMTIAEALLGPLLIWLSTFIIDELIRDVNLLSAFGPIYWLAILFILLTIVVDAIQPLVEMHKKLLTAQIQRNIDERLMQKANDLTDIAPFEQAGFHTKLKVARYNEYFITLWLDMTANALGGIVQIAAGSLLIWTVLPYAPLLFVMLALPRLFVEARLNNVTFEGRPQVQELRRRAEYFMGLPLQHEAANEIKLFNATPYFKAKYESATRELIAVLAVDQRKWTLHNMAWGLFEAIICGLALILIVRNAMAGKVQPGQLLLFIGALYQLREGVTQLFGVFAIGAREINNISSIMGFLHAELPEQTGEEPAPAAASGFRFERVRFAYREDQDTLHIEDLTIPAGHITVLIGENGSGKSTLLKLLLRFYEPVSGTIYYNGNPLRDYRIHELRRHTTAIFQDFVRYEMNMNSNIGIGHLPEMKQPDLIRKAAQIGGASSVAEKLPEGYETEIGRLFNGINLSGGEWQRIATSRAYMREESAYILLFDEPTSALDPYAEYEMIRSLRTLAANKTVIIVSHRLSTAKLADHIVLLRHGEVAETGTHETLIRQDGLYAELHRMQSSVYEEE
ncbi:ABC transporter ATP-binding protein [Paenibacillus tarimensis]|uniref:ABC transporter ATP-binding protein n=1 Tax=Paenibacillus tarimensis TaxID=416012 RepID=UPI001F2C7984|nr:ABC transporter ATP-binding protein [Paenibacillus tarimensis]MCF2942775.1 ABC transporter ATP-binding protein/permease [Paenibacillus tarimensis]